MSPTDVRHGRSPSVSDDHAPAPQRRKSLLFCPECPHQSIPDGDWIEDDDPGAGVRRLRCPECETVLTERPLPDDSLATTERESTISATLGFGAVPDLLSYSVRFWLSWPEREENTC